MSPLSIVLLSPAHPLRGGIAASTERLALALQQAGHRVVIFSYSLQYPGFLFPGETQYSSDPAPQGLDIRTVLNSVNPLNWIKVGLALRKLRPDLIIPRYWLPFMGPCLGTVLRLARSNGHSRVIPIADNILPHEKRPGDRLFTRWFIGAVDACMVMSRSVEQDLRQFSATMPAACIPHPVYDSYGEQVGREEALQHLGLPTSPRYLLFFGLIRDYKGLDLLLQAMAEPRLQHLELRLLVAGEYYGNRERYEQLIAGLGIADRLVLHTSFIPTSEVKYYFGAADLVVQPYKSATQSGISQVAYHFGKPMVVTPVGGLPEIVPHGKAGYVVPGQPGDIAAAIADFFENSRAEELSRGVASEKGRFTWEAMVKGLEGLYAQVK
jgi:D-inositol-3-phosphate glycosyltransferase